MFPGLTELDVPVLAKVLRRTVVSALIVGAVAVVISLLLSAPLAGLGIAVGVAAALINLRFLDANVAKVQTGGETNRKVVRRLIGTKTATRLAVITAVAVGLLLLSAPLGLGMVIGLVIFQLLFVVHVARAVLGGGGVV